MQLVPDAPPFVDCAFGNFVLQLFAFGHVPFYPLHTDLAAGFIVGGAPGAGRPFDLAAFGHQAKFGVCITLSHVQLLPMFEHPRLVIRVDPVNKSFRLHLGKSVAGQLFERRTGVKRVPLHIEEEKDFLGVLRDQPQLSFALTQGLGRPLPVGNVPGRPHQPEYLSVAVSDLRRGE